MKSYFFALVVLILAVDAVKALECYECVYLEGGDVGDIANEDWFDKSCKSGKKPKGKLAVTCPSGYDVCVKLFAEGTFSSGGKIKTTERGCGTSDGFLEDASDKCKRLTSSELSDLIELDLPSNFKGNLCMCSDDNCNSSSMLKVTQTLIFVGLCICSSKFMGFY